VDDIWLAQIGRPLDVPVSAALPPIPVPPGDHVEQLLWHGDPPGARLRAHVASRDARTVTVRLTADGRIVADLRVRRGPARVPRQHPLLRSEPPPGTSYTRLFTVTAADTTDHVPDTEPVLSTPSLIAFMEDTAADILRARFAPGTASLGTWIGVRHTGPARTGQEVTVTAVVAETRGRRYLFDVLATVDAHPIGDGQVAQTLIHLPPA
jgi:fluoroacetyl-CoA thioesterase